MENRISILIVDDNIQFGDSVKKYIDLQDEMYTAEIARDGLEAIEKIISLHPDVVLLDVVMPHRDGISVLEEMQHIQLEKRPVFIMLTAIGQDNFIRKAMALGADYYLIKPFELDILASRILQIYHERSTAYFNGHSNIEEKDRNKVPQDEYDKVVFLKEDSPSISTRKISFSSGASTLMGLHKNNGADMEIEVTKLMHDIGIPSHLAGYHYIREAIIRSVIKEKSFISVTKEIYPDIASQYGTSPGKVERAIRGAIQKTWGKVDSSVASKLFIYAERYNGVRPTNSEFIATLADKVRMKMNR